MRYLSAGIAALALSCLSCSVIVEGILEKPDGLIDGLDDGDVSSDDVWMEPEYEILVTCGNGELDDREECDDGNEVAGDGCEPGYCVFSCHEDRECDDGLGCTEDRCELTGRTCEHLLMSLGAACWPAQGDCDIVETCDGVDRDCPPDEVLPAGTPCREPVGVCDILESCPGNSPLCPADAFVDEGTPCGGGTYCVLEACDGLGGCVSTSMPILYDVAAISAGRYHTCALTTGGGVKCWGENGDGQLGDGSTTGSPVPVDVQGLSSGVSAVAAGAGHSCAFVSGGEVMCWGLNAYGQLGDGSTASSSMPKPVDSLSSPATSITAGNNHTCALLETGDVQCWGGNWRGQLGDGTTDNSSIPVSVASLASGVLAIAAGSSHTCALLDPPAVQCWGDNQAGQLGDNSVVDRLTPVDVLGLPPGAAAVSAGTEYSCAARSTGGVLCWGRNTLGQLGHGDTADHLLPVAVANLFYAALEISAGDAHACALEGPAAVDCWGKDEYGQLGDGRSGSGVFSATPVVVDRLPAVGVGSIACGGEHTCALNIDNTVVCWGANGSGQLGDGTNADSLTPVWVACN